MGEDMGELMTITTVVILTFVVTIIWLKLKNKKKRS